MIEATSAGAAASGCKALVTSAALGEMYFLSRNTRFSMTCQEKAAKASVAIRPSVEMYPA